MSFNFSLSNRVVRTRCHPCGSLNASPRFQISVAIPGSNDNLTRRVTLVLLIIRIYRHLAHVRFLLKLTINKVRLRAVRLPIRLQIPVPQQLDAVAWFRRRHRPHRFVANLSHVPFRRVRFIVERIRSFVAFLIVRRVVLLLLLLLLLSAVRCSFVGTSLSSLLFAPGVSSVLFAPPPRPASSTTSSWIAASSSSSDSSSSSACRCRRSVPGTF